MKMATKTEIFDRYKQEYWNSSRKRKGEILCHIEDMTQMSRKAISKKLRYIQKKDPAKIDRRGRPKIFTKEADGALRTVWETANYPCGELLHTLVAEYVSILQRDNQWEHSKLATEMLLRMKEHTVRRRVQSFKTYHQKGKGISSTKPSHLKSIIPIFKGPWSTKGPGYGQLDTVAHCGPTLLGDFIYTLNYIDIATYWIVPVAQWNKGQEATVKSIEKVRDTLPFELLGLHPDTGSEFIHWLLKNWCGEKVELTRSEPGKKNDNMCVEERNGHVVRKYLGYERLDKPELVPIINELYEVLALYLNHFQAVRRTLKKERIGAKYKRTYEKKAKTPYQRVLERDDILDEVKEKLRREHEKLNPLNLKNRIDTLREEITKIRRLGN
jgi:hypothetical protein